MFEAQDQQGERTPAAPGSGGVFQCAGDKGGMGATLNQAAVPQGQDALSLWTCNPLIAQGKRSALAIHHRLQRNALFTPQRRGPGRRGRTAAPPVP